MKNGFSYKVFCSQDIQVFVFPSSPLEPPVSHCSSRWLKINDWRNQLTKQKLKNIVWYLEKEIRPDIETWSNGWDIFVEKVCRKCARKASPRPLFNLFNPFRDTDLFWYALTTSENHRFSDVFRGYQKRTVAWNGLITQKNSQCMQEVLLKIRYFDRAFS